MAQDSASANFAKKSESGPGIPGLEFHASGQDDYPENETAFSYSEMEFDDFDAQAEQLDGYDQEYIKIATDPFRGRFMSAFLTEDVSVHYETVNCAMYQRVSCPEGVIGFSVSLAQPESAANGIKLGRDDVIITRPGVELGLDMRLDTTRERTRDKQSAAVFTATRGALSVMEEFDYTTLSAVTGNSPRSIQLAFADHLQVPPRHYFRTVKLHRVRNALLNDPGDRSVTIGDIAAAHGFWNWSRFTQLYRQQFGETPSETRARAKGRPRHAGAA